MKYDVLAAIGLSLFAGLSTGIGGLFLLVFKKINTKILSVALGFSAGVMIYVSFVEILPEASKYLGQAYGVKKGDWITFIAFFAGIFLIAIIDKLVPEKDNPHEPQNVDQLDVCGFGQNSQKLIKTGKLAALAITIHNFPEGLATFVSGMNELSLGIAIAVAVAIHNIPEGISVALPIYCATGNKKKAFLMSLVSGLAEPAGAIIAFLFLSPFLNDIVFGIIYASIAGIMVFISLDELLPSAREYGEHHLAIFGLICGMIVMGLSLLLLG
ncbi:MAG: zinc transporter ZupT [Clostridiaceae bacterium]|jgi:ZIP family zinc transporter|nr:zinc transporter ZupT [Clostridiaceae bacterium]